MKQSEDMESLLDFVYQAMFTVTKKRLQSKGSRCLYRGTEREMPQVRGKVSGTGAEVFDAAGYGSEGGNSTWQCFR